MDKIYFTVVEAINDLVFRGYSAQLFHPNTPHQFLNPLDFTIDEVYRFEGETDPADESVVYAISSAKHHIKGVLVNGYGSSSDPDVSAMIEKLSIRH